MSSRRLAIRSVAFNWLGRAASLLIAFILTPIIIKGLGREAYGIWAIVMSVASYYALADFGMRGAAVKYIAQYSAGKDRESLNQVLAVSLRVYAILAAGTIAVSAAVAWLFPYVFDIQQQSTRSVQWTVFLCGAAVSARLLGQVFRAALNALIRFDARNILAITAQCLEAGLMIAAVWSGYGLVGMAVAVLFVAVLDQLAGAVVALRLLKPISLSRDNFDRDILGKLLRFGSLNVLVNVSGRASRFSGPIIIGALLEPAVVPFFAVADSLTHKALSLTKSVTSVVMPLSGRLHAQDRREDLAAVLVQTARILLAIALGLAVVFVFMGRSLIELWIGPGFSNDTYPILCVMTAALVVTMVSGGIPSMLTGTGHIRFVAAVQLIRAGITVVLSIVFVLLWGPIGAAWSALLPRVASHIFILPSYAARQYGLSWPVFMRRVGVSAVLATAPGLIVAAALANYAPPGRLLEWLIQACVVGTVTAVSTFLFCMDAGLQKEVLRLLRLNGRTGVDLKKKQSIQDQPSP